MKPISTLARPLPSADLVTGESVERAHYERSDISVVPAAGVIGEAMVMLTLLDFVLDKFGGDSLAETRDNLERYRERISQPPEAPIAGGRAAPRERDRRQRPDRGHRAHGRSRRGDRRRGRLRRGRLSRRWTSS